MCVMGAEIELVNEGFDIGIRESWERAIEDVKANGGKPYPIPAGASARLEPGSDFCDRVDFDQSTQWKSNDLDARPGGERLGKITRVDLIDCRKIIHAREKHRGANDLGQGRSRAGQDRIDVPQRLICLRSCIQTDHLAGRRVERDLTGGPHPAVEYHAL